MDYADLKMELEYVTQRRPLREGDSLAKVLQRLDEAAHEQELPDRLKHFLGKRSYLKALAWLDDPDMPHHA